MFDIFEDLPWLLKVARIYVWMKRAIVRHAMWLQGLGPSFYLACLLVLFVVTMSAGYMMILNFTFLQARFVLLGRRLARHTKSPTAQESKAAPNDTGRVEQEELVASEPPAIIVAEADAAAFLTIPVDDVPVPESSVALDPGPIEATPAIEVEQELQEERVSVELPAAVEDPPSEDMPAADVWSVLEETTRLPSTLLAEPVPLITVAEPPKVVASVPKTAAAEVAPPAEEALLRQAESVEVEAPPSEDMPVTEVRRELEEAMKFPPTFVAESISFIAVAEPSKVVASVPGTAAAEVAPPADEALLQQTESVETPLSADMPATEVRRESKEATKLPSIDVAEPVSFIAAVEPPEVIASVPETTAAEVAPAIGEALLQQAESAEAPPSEDMPATEVRRESEEAMKFPLTFVAEPISLIAVVEPPEVVASVPETAATEVAPAVGEALLKQAESSIAEVPSTIVARPVPTSALAATSITAIESSVTDAVRRVKISVNAVLPVTPPTSAAAFSTPLSRPAPTPAPQTLSLRVNMAWHKRENASSSAILGQCRVDRGKYPVLDEMPWTQLIRLKDEGLQAAGVHDLRIRRHILRVLWGVRRALHQRHPVGCELPPPPETPPFVELLEDVHAWMQASGISGAQRAIFPADIKWDELRKITKGELEGMGMKPGGIIRLLKFIVEVEEEVARRKESAPYTSPLALTSSSASAF
ncbi:hypothetical protein BOTBODRAFT_71072 [Botryobasidium botryosum FD-172 SS1]|uniref:SAM domain-containing protein n=1 Tax=Botryobasidium botryosum (strain FD-172 SS1) TaxID=930990 RepID=A0A067LVB9_BOTB1|nr:hypothetical protein BOTBODRAFT_71072 [Botryobasidium botryosum FD-172 SS1]